MDGIGKKWKTMADSLFRAFSDAMAEHGYGAAKEVTAPWYVPENLRELSDYGVKEHEIVDTIRFAVKNWGTIRGHKSMKGLSAEPVFKEIVSKWRMQEFIYLFRCGEENLVEQVKKFPNKDHQQLQHSDPKSKEEAIEAVLKKYNMKRIVLD